MLATALIFIAGCGHRCVEHKLSERKLKRIKQFSMPLPGKPITILIHGTRLPPFAMLAFPPLIFGSTTPAGLHKITDVSSLYYYARMAFGLNKIDPVGFAQENLYLFGWSGVLDGVERELNGELLYHCIKRIRSDKRFRLTPITIITISHGGNVALNIAKAAHKYNDVSTHIDRLILLCCPIQDETHDYVYSPMFTSVFNIFSTSDFTQVADPQQLDNWDVKTATFFSRRTFDRPAPHLKQIAVANKKHKLGHMDFVCADFYEKMPALLDVFSKNQSKYIPVDGIYNIDLGKL